MKKVLLLIMFAMLFVSCQSEVLEINDEAQTEMKVGEYRQATAAEIQLANDLKSGLRVKIPGVNCSGYLPSGAWKYAEGYPAVNEATDTYVVIATTLDGQIYGTYVNESQNTYRVRLLGNENAQVYGSYYCSTYNLQQP